MSHIAPLEMDVYVFVWVCLGVGVGVCVYESTKREVRDMIPGACLNIK